MGDHRDDDQGRHENGRKQNINQFWTSGFPEASHLFAKIRGYKKDS